MIGTLKHLKTLDGTEVSKSERIQAVQDLSWIRSRIEAAELAHRVSREGERRKAEAEIASKRHDYDDPSLSVDERRRRFFQVRLVVWSLTHSYSVGFLQSRISTKNMFLDTHTIKIFISYF